MKKLSILAVLSLIGCTAPVHTKKLLQDEGYTDIKITGYELWACGHDEMASTGFEAKNLNGKVVRGVVCDGWITDSTIRFK